MEDYFNLVSKPAFYITHRNWRYIMHTFKWDPLFNLEGETTMVIAWISFPALPPNCFGKESVLSLAAVIGNKLI